MQCSAFAKNGERFSLKVFLSDFANASENLKNDAAFVLY